MTRAEYESKYGTSPVLPVSPAPSSDTSQKVHMTRAEYQAKYGVAPQVAEPTIEQQRAERIRNGQAVSVNPDKVDPSLGGEILRGAIKAPLKAALSIPAGVMGDKGITVKSKYLGDTSDILKTVSQNSERLAGKVNRGEISKSRAIAGVIGNAALQTADVASAVPLVGSVEDIVLNTGKAVAKKTATQVAERTAGSILKNVAKSYGRGAATGALYDVGNQLSSGEKFNPVQTLEASALGGAVDVGASQLAPAVIGKAKGALSGVLTEEGRVNSAVAKREKEIGKFEKYQTIKKITENARGKGNDPIKMLSKTDVLAGAVDDTGTVKTLGEGGAHERYNAAYVKPVEGVVRKNLEIEGRTIPLATVEARLKQAVNSSNLEGEALINAQGKVEREIAGLEARAKNVVRDENGKIIGGEIPVVKIHDAKVNKYDTIDYLNPASKKADKTIARTYKDLVQENTKNIDVEKINKDLGKHYEVLNLLEKLDNKKVDGGKLGKYFAQGIGGLVGSHFGPIGTIAGAEAGSFIKGRMMASKFSSRAAQVIEQSPEMKQALKNIVEAEDAATEEAYKKKLRSMLEAKNIAPQDAPSLYEPYIPDEKMPVIDFGKPAKPKTDTSLPVASDQELPQVAGPGPIPQPIKKAPVEEPYIPQDQLPSIDFGKPAKKKADSTPIAEKDSLPKVYLPRNSSIAQKTNTSPIKVASNPNMEPTIPYKKNKVNLPTSEVKVSPRTGKSTNLPSSDKIKGIIKMFQESKADSKKLADALKEQNPDINGVLLEDVADKARAIREGNSSVADYVRKAVARLKK